MDQNSSYSSYHQSVDVFEIKENISTTNSGKTLNESLEHIFDNEILTDVTFVLGPESIPVKSHKVILVSRSSVFKAMFDGSSTQKGDIKIEDADEEHFKIFLRFLYTDSVNLTVDHVLPLICLAEKYDVWSLKKQCEEFLEANLQAENACKTLETANTYNMAYLHKVCLDFIGIKSEECLKSRSFLEVNGETVDLITKSEILSCQEERIFEALDRWADVQCNRRKMEVDSENKKNVIHKYLGNIRFPLMSHQYMIHEVPKHNYLTAEEVLEIMNSNTNPQTKTFNSNPRLGLKSNEIFRFQNGPVDLESCVQGGEVNAISFKVSHHSWLYGTYVYGSPKKQQSIVEIRVTRGETNISQVKRNVKVGAPTTLHTILFKAPVYIPANEEHTIYLGLFGADTNEFYGKPAKDSKPIFGCLSPFGQQTTDTSMSTPCRFIHISKENKTFYPWTQSKSSVTTQFRYKTIDFFNSNLQSNRSCVRGGQIPGLLLF